MDLDLSLMRNYCFDYYNYYINRIHGLCELPKLRPVSSKRVRDNGLYVELESNNNNNNKIKTNVLSSCFERIGNSKYLDLRGIEKIHECQNRFVRCKTRK